VAAPQRAVLLALFAGLLATSAWAVIFTAMSVARPGIVHLCVRLPAPN
jgi:hypothetical protein